MSVATRRFDTRGVRLAAALVVWEAALTALYFRETPADPTSLRYVVYPFVWVNVAALAVAGVGRVAASRRQRLVALAVAVPYTLALLYVPGIVQYSIPGIAPLDIHASGWSVLWASPGWGPTVSYRSNWLLANLVPFKLAGYLALGYLVYANLVRTAKSALSGVFGLVTCVSCVAPIFTGVAGALGGAAVAHAATTYSLDLGTIAFVASTAVLYAGANGYTFRPWKN